jgi:rubrerythrin
MSEPTTPDGQNHVHTQADHACAHTYSFPPRAANRQISDEELWELSYYRASELAGSLLMGRLAKRVRDEELRSRLTWHFAEEARHAWRWTEVIRTLGADPLPVTETYQSNYLSRVGIPRDELEILALTYIFERRVAQHFALHRQLPGLNPLVRETLATMCSEEGPHLRWIRERLDAEAATAGRERVDEVVRRYEALDKEIYRAEIQKFTSRGWKLPIHVLNELERAAT